MSTAFDSYCEQAIGSQQAQFGAGIYQGLMRMWHGVLFGTLVWDFPNGDTPESILNEKLAADPGFQANVGARNASVVPKPFIDPKKDIPKS
jgi:hypothetical protein